MDNEPELWGYTHYDVHPDCPGYGEILDKYIEYSTAIRDVVPEAMLTGPVTCCYWYYWNSAAGRRRQNQLRQKLSRLDALRSCAEPD